MRQLILFSLLVLSLLSCKEVVEEGTEELYETDTISHSNALVDTTAYPAPLIAVLNAHGGLQEWQRMSNLCFEIKGSTGTEIHTVSLPDRKTKIAAENWSIGYDGHTVWLQERAPNAYSGNARFYHNLMFYFYAMPFVLADPGIRYEKLPPAELEGRTYEGLKISYDEGVGDSPEDEYRIYFDPETHKMEWLGYTVTYQEQQKSDDWHYIHYSNWQKVSGLLLPETLSWYGTENGLPSKKRNELSFTKVTITETTLEDSVFEKPPGAVVVER